LQKSKKLVLRGVRTQNSGARKAWIIQNPKSKIQNYLTERSIFARGLNGGMMSISLLSKVKIKKSKLKSNSNNPKSKI
jgi:hypothetical protein